MDHLEATTSETTVVVPCIGDRVVVGRGEDCGLVLADEAVSRRHAMLELRDDGWWVSDLSSRNGTLVNNERVLAPTPVGPEDVIRIANAEVRLLPQLDGTGSGEMVRWDGDPDNWVALSRGEEQVVRLVAEGHTDAQIAKALFIDGETVQSHLDRIQDKTGCRRREDLAVLAVQRGLVR